MSRIWIRRAYEPPTRNDGYRILVDRLWPRGISKAELAIDDWSRELAPSAELREWFSHDPERWKDFRRRYTRELQNNTGAVHELLEHVKRGRVTLVYGARDPDYNNAVALRAFLEEQWANTAPRE